MRIIVAHAAWRVDRRPALRRLLGQIGGDVLVSVSPGPEHAAIWARRTWELAERAGDGQHVCILNDDVLLAPNFRAILDAMVAAVPDQPLSLHTNVPGAVDAAQTGHAWCRSYWYTGPAVVLAPEHVRSLLAYTYSLPWSFLARVNEDNLAIHWAWQEQRPLWCAIPAPVDHDTSIPSTLGYDDHPLRRPVLTWASPPFEREDLTDPERWRAPVAPPLVENPWMPVAKLDYVRRLLSGGGQLCAMCGAREGTISVSPNSIAPRACHTCALTLYSAAQRTR